MYCIIEFNDRPRLGIDAILFNINSIMIMSYQTFMLLVEINDIHDYFNAFLGLEFGMLFLKARL